MRLSVAFVGCVLGCVLAAGACNNAGTSQSSVGGAAAVAPATGGVSGTGTGTGAAASGMPNAGAGASVASSGGTAAIGVAVAGTTASTGGAGASDMTTAGTSAAGAGAAGAGDGAAGSTTANGAKPQLAVTADFLNQSLSIVDVGKLKDGAKREDALVGTVDLSMYTPGPLALAITPDGKTALASISAGFIGAFATVPAGNGTLVFVDLETRKVLGDLYTGNSPMGIIITPDGKRAFVGQYSETYFAVVDIEKRTIISKVQTGQSYNEELAMDDTGTVGCLSFGPLGNVTTFPILNPMPPLGATNGLTGDAGGVAFFPGTKKAFVIQAPTSLTGNVGGHNVVDVTNPAMPVASDNIRNNNQPTTYPVTANHARNSIVFPQTMDNKVSVVEMKLNGDVAQMVQTVEVGASTSLAYGVASAPDGTVLIAVPTEHYIGVVDLVGAKAFMVPWDVTKAGPNDIKLIPNAP